MPATEITLRLETVILFADVNHLTNSLYAVAVHLEILTAGHCYASLIE